MPISTGELGLTLLLLTTQSRHPSDLVYCEHLTGLVTNNTMYGYSYALVRMAGWVSGSGSNGGAVSDAMEADARCLRRWWSYTAALACPRQRPTLPSCLPSSSTLPAGTPPHSAPLPRSSAFPMTVRPRQELVLGIERATVQTRLFSVLQPAAENVDAMAQAVIGKVKTLGKRCCLKGTLSGVVPPLSVREMADIAEAALDNQLVSLPPPSYRPTRADIIEMLERAYKN